MGYAKGVEGISIPTRHDTWAETELLETTVAVTSASEGLTARTASTLVVTGDFEAGLIA